MRLCLTYTLTIQLTTHEQMTAGIAQASARGLRKVQRRNIVIEKQMYEG